LITKILFFIIKIYVLFTFIFTGYMRPEYKFAIIKFPSN
jgi:hypothetical protein